MMRKSFLLSIGILTLGTLSLGWLGSQRAVATNGPQLSCTPETGTGLRPTGCTFLIPVSAGNSDAAVERAALNNAIELQFFTKRTDNDEIFFKIVRHVDGRIGCWGYTTHTTRT